MQQRIRPTASAPRHDLIASKTSSGLCSLVAGWFKERPAARVAVLCALSSKVTRLQPQPTFVTCAPRPLTSALPSCRCARFPPITEGEPDFLARAGSLYGRARLHQGGRRGGSGAWHSQPHARDRPGRLPEIRVVWYVWACVYVCVRALCLSIHLSLFLRPSNGLLPISDSLQIICLLRKGAALLECWKS